MLLKFSKTSLFFLLIISGIGNTIVLAQSNKKKKDYEVSRHEVNISNYALSLKLNEFMNNYTGRIEFVADSLSLETKKTKIKRELLLWKIYGTTVMEKALFKNDPLAAFIDGWVLNMQLINYFKSHEAEERFMEFQPAIENLSINLELKISSIYDSLVDIQNKDSFEKNLETFASNHHISDKYLNRESTTEHIAPWLGESQIKLKSEIFSVTEGVRDLSNRMVIFTDLTPKKIKWQMEYALLNYADSDSIKGYLERSITSVEKMASTVEKTEELLNYNRAASFSSIDSQRIHSLYFIKEERKALLATIIEERRTVLDSLIKQRIAFEKMIERERTASFNEVNTILGQSSAKVDTIIDKLFYRALILIGIIGLFGLAGIYLFKKI